MRIDYPIQWDDRDNFERPSKGWLDGVIVTAVDGSRHELSFYDPVRLQQDLEEAIAQGRVGIVERGLMVIPEVTKENIEKAIRQASAAGYFHRGSDGGSQSE